MRVGIGSRFEARERLRADLDPSIDLLFGDAITHCDVLVAGTPSETRLERSGAPVLIIPYAGVPDATRELAQRHDLTVYNLHHNAAPTAEHAIALLLAARRRVVAADRELRAGDWSRRWAFDDGALLEGREAVVLGYGAIGSRVARALLGLGMRVHAVRRRRTRTSEGHLTQSPPSELDTLLPRASVLVLALPSTPATRGLLDARRLALLPSDCTLVNVARGDILDERALFEALSTGKIHSAGLDTWWRYPQRDARTSTPPSELPFHTLETVVLSPHRAGHVSDTEPRRARHLATLLNQLVRGCPPDPVDLELGY